MNLKNISSPKSKLGLSIYPNKASSSELITYLQTAKKYNFTRIFTNLIGLTKNELDNFVKVASWAKANGFEVIVDIDQSVCLLFNKEINDFAFWKELGITGLRLDVKFPAKEIADFTHNQEGLLIEINASDFSNIEKEIMQFPIKQNKISSCHNFFPQKYTALSLAKFTKANKQMQKFNLPISAFATIGKDAIGAWDEHQGTPSLEILRNMDICDQFQFLMRISGISCILVSDMFLSEAKMQQINQLENRKLFFDCQVEKNISANEKTILQFEDHALRGDNPEEIMFRSTISRKQFKDLDIKPDHLVQTLMPGDVVILNNKAGRYKGELHIIKKQILSDETKNLVAKISNTQLPLLELSAPLLKFAFKKIKE